MAGQILRIAETRPGRDMGTDRLNEYLNGSQRRNRMRGLRWLPVGLLIALLLLWHLATQETNQLTFVLSSPGAVLAEFGKMIGNGTLFGHIQVTLTEIGLGFALGTLSAFVLGYGIARNRLLEAMLGPYAVGFQAVPIIAIAPILIRFLGPGVVTNGIICALIVFFPMLINTIVGVRNVDPDLRLMMRALHASRWQMFRYLELPSALASVFGGLKISTTLAVIGSVVGEAISSSAGLGFLIYSSRYVYNTAGVFVGVFALTALALMLYEVMARLERRILAWRRAMTEQGH